MMIFNCVLLLTQVVYSLGVEEIGSTGSSQETCSQLQGELGVTKSGYYHLKQHNVYCNMELDCGGYKGGWTRVVSFNIYRGDKCPQGWQVDHGNYIGRHFCTGGYKAGCYAAQFSTNQTHYTRMCGRLRGYQKGSMNAFFPAAYTLGTASGYKPEEASSSINGPYVDGVSITVGHPRKHIWTYAVGLSDDYNFNYSTGGYNCPCAQHPGPDPPSFVQNHYYCESGISGRFTAGKYYTSDALWDGNGCGKSNNCCTQVGLPWFFRQFSIPLTDNIEVRICRDQNIIDEEVLIEEMEIYIQ